MNVRCRGHAGCMHACMGPIEADEPAYLADAVCNHAAVVVELANAKSTVRAVAGARRAPEFAGVAPAIKAVVEATFNRDALPSRR